MKELWTQPETFEVKTAQGRLLMTTAYEHSELPHRTPSYGKVPIVSGHGSVAMEYSAGYSLQPR